MHKVILVFVLVLTFISSANAMQFQAIHEGNGFVVQATGEIFDEDFEKFKDFMDANDLSSKTTAFILDSGGGSVPAAGRISQIIRSMRKPVMVFAPGKCLSACFLMFSAGVQRHVFGFPDVGSHRISKLITRDAGMDHHVIVAETSFTGILNRAAGQTLLDYGVPPEIVIKIMSTSPGQIYRLDQQDFTKMRVIEHPALSSE